jgi:hypothetical protein
MLLNLIGKQAPLHYRSTLLGKLFHNMFWEPRIRTRDCHHHDTYLVHLLMKHVQTMHVRGKKKWHISCQQRKHKIKFNSENSRLHRHLSKSSSSQPLRSGEEKKTVLQHKGTTFVRKDFLKQLQIYTVSSVFNREH